MCACGGGQKGKEGNAEKQKTREVGGERYKNIRKLKNKAVVWDQQEEGRARDER